MISLPDHTRTQRALVTQVLVGVEVMNPGAEVAAEIEQQSTVAAS